MSALQQWTTVRLVDHHAGNMLTKVFTVYIFSPSFYLNIMYGIHRKQDFRSYIIGRERYISRFVSLREKLCACDFTVVDSDLNSFSEAHQEVWRKHKKHVFILTNAGKPIYSRFLFSHSPFLCLSLRSVHRVHYITAERYGDESKLSGFMGLLQALVSFADDAKDTLRSARRCTCTCTCIRICTCACMCSYNCNVHTFCCLSSHSGLTRQCRFFGAGHHRVVFVVKGPIVLVCVSCTSEPVHVLEQQLGYMHAQIISILTSGVNRILINKPNVDVRNLLGGETVSWN